MRDVVFDMRMSHALFKLWRVPGCYGDAAPPIFPWRPDPFFKPEQAHGSRKRTNGKATSTKGRREKEG